jgi:hypothetical protein
MPGGAALVQLALPLVLRLALPLVPVVLAAVRLVR